MSNIFSQVIANEDEFLKVMNLSKSCKTYSDINKSSDEFYVLFHVKLHYFLLKKEIKIQDVESFVIFLDIKRKERFRYKTKVSKKIEICDISFLRDTKKNNYK